MGPDGVASWMSDEGLPSDFLRLLKSVEAKRPRTVIEHILEHGQITTEELRDLYGYNHPPRAVRDVREQGIPIETFRVTGSDGRRIAAYRFGDPSQVRAAQLSGRTAFGARLRAALVDKYGSRCNIYLADFPERDLQIDHRIPFEVTGEGALSVDPADFMLLCPSANRAKSWSCENCPNWQTRDPEICRSCYWAYPEDYSHVATRDIRRLDVLWVGDEATEYDSIARRAEDSRQLMPEYVKNVLREHVLNRIEELE